MADIKKKISSKTLLSENLDSLQKVVTGITCAPASAGIWGGFILFYCGV